MTLAVSVIDEAYGQAVGLHADRAVLDHAADAEGLAGGRLALRPRGMEEHQVLLEGAQHQGDRANSRPPAADQHQTFDGLSTWRLHGGHRAFAVTLAASVPRAAPAAFAGGTVDPTLEHGTSSSAIARTRGRSCPTRKRRRPHVQNADQLSHCCIRHALRRFRKRSGAPVSSAPTHSVWRSRSRIIGAPATAPPAM